MSDAKQINITVEGFEASDIERRLADLIGHQVEEGLSRRVAAELDRAVHAHVANLVNEIARDRVATLVDECFAQGWQKTDSYGNPSGATLSLRDRVRAALDETSAYDRVSMVQKVIGDSAKGELEKILKVELAAAQVKLREAFDAVIREKFTESIRKALGVAL